MHPTLKKLQFKEQPTALVHCTPSSFAEVLTHLNELTQLDQTALEGNQYDFALFFCEKQADLSVAANKISEFLHPESLLWIAYPKKSSKRYKSDITRDQGWESIGALGYEPVRQIAIDEDWSALRFRPVDQIKNLTRRSSMILSEEGKKRKEEKDS